MCPRVYTPRPRGTHPPLNRMTDKFKNITFPQLRLRAVIMNFMTHLGLACEVLPMAFEFLQPGGGEHKPVVAPVSQPNATSLQKLAQQSQNAQNSTQGQCSSLTWSIIIECAFSQRDLSFKPIENRRSFLKAGKMNKWTHDMS